MKNRDISLDIIRVIACILVVSMHSPIPSPNANGVFLSALSYFTAPCIGLFFMVSGALLLPVRENYTTFLKHRFGKVIVPTLFWTAIYITINVYNAPDYGNLAKTVFSIPFSAQGNGVLWFMYTLAGIYLLAPIVSSWLEKAGKKDVEMVLLLWTITLCYPILELLVDINTSDTGILYYFGGYAGYFLLGFYLKKYTHTVSLPISITIGLLGAIVYLLTKIYSIDVDFYRMFWYLSIFIVALCVSIWKIVTRFANGLTSDEHHFLTGISNLSFGIYLCHIFVMRELLCHVEWINKIGNYSLQSVVVTILTFVLSIALCYILSRLPFGQWLIGYKKLQK